MKVEFTAGALAYFNDLSTILYQKHYFSFEDKALEYVDSLIDDIIDTLPDRRKKMAPDYFKKYGDKLFYATFKKNKHTQWYIFFNLYEEKGELIYLVRYISNNHMIAQYL